MNIEPMVSQGISQRQATNPCANHRGAWGEKKKKKKEGGRERIGLFSEAKR